MPPRSPAGRSSLGRQPHGAPANRARRELSPTRLPDGTASPEAEVAGMQSDIDALQAAQTLTQAEVDAVEADVAAIEALLPAGAIVGTTDVQTLTNKTLTTPTIGSFTNANHTHLDAAGGGQLGLGAISVAAGSVPFGSGSALTTDPDGFQFLTATKRLGLNMPSGVAPNATLAAYSTTSPFIGTRISASANANAFTARKARGADINSPTKVLNGDGMGAFASQGYEEVTPTYRQTGIFQFAAREDFTNTAGGTALRLDMCPVGSVTTQLALFLTTEQLQLQTTTAIPAGGTTGLGLAFSSTANFGVFYGSGAPSLSAAKGSLYLRSDGSGTTDRAYINTDGGTTWTALTTVA